MLTRQEIFKEYARCLTNPIYAIETYLETFDKTQEGFVPFRLFPRQKETSTWPAIKKQPGFREICSIKRIPPLHLKPIRYRCHDAAICGPHRANDHDAVDTLQAECNREKYRERIRATRILGSQRRWSEDIPAQ